MASSRALMRLLAGAFLLLLGNATDGHARISLPSHDSSHPGIGAANHDAATRVHEFSKRHVGSNLALVVDGKVHGTPRIAAEITGNKYQIDGFDRADAERLATSIGSGCRR